jgi:hypothetical protein
VPVAPPTPVAPPAPLVPPAPTRPPSPVAPPVAVIPPLADAVVPPVETGCVAPPAPLLDDESPSELHPSADATATTAERTAHGSRPRGWFGAVLKTKARLGFVGMYNTSDSGASDATFSTLTKQGACALVPSPKSSPRSTRRIARIRGHRIPGPSAPRPGDGASEPANMNANSAKWSSCLLAFGIQGGDTPRRERVMPRST